MPLRGLPQPRSLSARLTVYHSITYLTLLATSFILVYFAIGTELDKRTDEDLFEDIAEFRQRYTVSGVDPLIAALGQEVTDDEFDRVILRLYSAPGTLVFTTDERYWRDFTADGNLLARQFSGATSPVLRTLALPSHDAGVRAVYGALSADHVLVIAESLDNNNKIMEILYRSFIVVFLLALPVISVLVWILTRRSVAGLHAVSNAARDIQAGHLERRVNAREQVSEIQTLADTFDSMAARIQTLVHNMREMTDNIAHDLRSPIGRVRLLSESALRSAYSIEDYRVMAEATMAECDRLINMINVSLDVTETEAGVARETPEPINPRALIADVCELFEPVAEDKGITLFRTLKDTQSIRADRTRLQRMVANLMDNAVKFTPQQGVISIHLEQKDDLIALNIRNSGSQIAESDYENIFSRFYRVDPSRSAAGCGLGLSYARAVARALHGDIVVHSEPGPYTEFIVTLPVQ